MRFKQFSRMMAIPAVALTLALSGCGGSSETPEPPPEPMPMPDPGPTDQETTAGAAADAAEAAMVASAAAMASSEAAAEATANLATMQTNGKAGMYAAEAAAAAAMAMAEYENAKAAAAAAAAATLASEAGVALAAAEAAQAAAEAAAMTAAMKSEAAVEAAMMELMIDGTMKSVGESMVDAEAAASTKTIGEGASAKKVITGLLSLGPTGSGPAVSGLPYLHPEPTDNAATLRDESVARPYRQAVQARTFALGKVLDTSDDMARLQLVTKYAGSKAVNVYALSNRNPVTAVDGTVSDGTAHVNFVIQTDAKGEESITVGDATLVAGGVPDLTPVGTFYRATNIAADGTVVTAADAENLTDVDRVGSTAKGEVVYSYTHPGATAATSDDVTRYVVLASTNSVVGGNTDDTYQHVDITAPAASALPATDDTPGTQERTFRQVRVRANVPAALDYSHIHFGAWAGLSAAKATGAQTIADLGIGFVQSIGTGMTGADMPNSGSASYTGNWVGTVQAADAAGKGVITMRNGGASVDANFGAGTIEASLAGLATLEGTIAGNAFSGTKATVAANDPYGLQSSATFSGSFDGAFYGSGASEAGGTFDFGTTESAGGAFRGAFGGHVDP